MSYQHVSNWRRRAKLSLVDYKGGQCERCGYNKKQYPSAFVFHHVDPQQKDFSLCSKNWAFERLKREADKCILVCRTCHAEIHEEDKVLSHEMVSQKERKCDFCQKIFTIKRQDQRYCSRTCAKQIYGSTHKSKKVQKRTVYRRICKQCHVKYKTTEYRQKYCSYECHKKSLRKTERPTKQQLDQDISMMSWCAIGRKYGVSDNAVRKWARQYDLL